MEPLQPSGWSRRLRVVATTLILFVPTGCESLESFSALNQSSQGPVQPLLIADFNQPGHQTNLGTPFGAWEQDPGDTTQHCAVRLVGEPRLGNEGYSLMLDYDVDSPNPAYCGFWMKLPHVAWQPFTTLRFSLKGDAEKRFTTRLRLELKDGSRVATYTLDGLEAEWKAFAIPLRDFDGISRLRRLAEFVIVFEDTGVTEKTGAMYLDDVQLE